MNKNLPTFPDICRSHNVDSSTLMKEADVPSAVVDQMYYAVDHPVSRVDAEKVMEAFSRLAQTNYTLDMVFVPIEISAHEIQSEVARTLQQIDLETEASRAALYGLAEVAQHERRINHTERMAEQVIALHEIGGDEAVHLLFDQWNNGAGHSSSTLFARKARLPS